MKTLLSLLVTVVYLASVFGTIVMHIWAVAGMWESTKGLVGFLLFIFSMFTLFITELFILYQHVSYSGWFGSPYSIAATIHLLGLAVVMLIAQCSLWMKKEDQQEANKLGLSENEFEDFMKIGNMSPSEMFAENKEGKENFLQVTSEMIKSEEEKISNLAINCYRVKIPWSIAFKEVDASYEDDNAGFMFERL